MVPRRRCADRARIGRQADHPGELALRADQKRTAFGGSSAERGLSLQRHHQCPRWHSKFTNPQDRSPRSQNLSASPGGALTCVIEHIGHLRRRNRDLAIRRRRPDELPAIEPLGVERQADAVVPEDLDQVAATSTKNERSPACGSRPIVPEFETPSPFMPRRMSVSPRQAKRAPQREPGS